MSDAPALAPCAYIATTAAQQGVVMGSVSAALVVGGVFLEESVTIGYGDSVGVVRQALTDRRAVTGMTVPPPSIKIVVVVSTLGIPGPTSYAAVCQWLNGFPDDIWCLVIAMDDATAWPSTGQGLQAKLAAIYGPISNERILPQIATPVTLSTAVMAGVATILTVRPSIRA
jgi:hypothetical protein